MSASESSPRPSELQGSSTPTPAASTLSVDFKKKVGFLTKVTSALSAAIKLDGGAAASAHGDDNGEAGPELRKTKTGRRTGTKKSKSVSLEDLQAEEEQRRLLLNESLTSSERAFLPAQVRQKLGERNALPDCPLMEQSTGVVLFADISGFTHLGKLLRSQLPPLEAAARLANRIGTVLKELTTVCVQEFGGDVVKFAGDALLCVFPYLSLAKDGESALLRAKACAVAMLKRIKEVDPQLDLHGGIALGNLLNLHLGDTKRELAWYVLTGDAVVRAANLVEHATRGTILLDLQPGSEPETLTVTSQFDLSPQVLQLAADEAEALSNLDVTPKGRAYIPRGLRNVLMSDRTGSGEMRRRVAILFAALPRLSMSQAEMTSNSLSDARKLLLNSTFSHISLIVRKSGGEFRDLLFDDKGCVFIAVFGAYEEVEMAELKALKAAKRMQDELEVEELKIGLSVGTCFVGLVGNETRLDMIVMGNEVNMAARYMGKAQEGTILCSEQIMRATKDFFQFESVKLDLKKKKVNDERAVAVQEMTKTASGFMRFELYDNDLLGEAAVATAPGSGGEETRQLSKRSASVTADPNGLVTGYRPLREITKRGSFYSMYRYVEVIPDSLFQGRKDELKRLQAHIVRASTNKQFSVGFLSGPRGYGKSWLVRELRRKMTSHAFAIGVAFELNAETELYALRQLVETLFEAFDGMPKKKASTLVSKWHSANIKLDYVAVETLLPYLANLVLEKSLVSNGGWGGVSKRFGNRARRHSGNGSFTSMSSSQLPSSGMEFGELSDAMRAPAQNSPSLSFKNSIKLRRHGDSSSAAAADGSTRQHKSESFDGTGNNSSSRMFKARATSLIEDPIEEETAAALAASATNTRLNSSGGGGGGERIMSMNIPSDVVDSLNVQLGGGSRRKLFASFRSGSVAGRSGTASMTFSSPPASSQSPQLQPQPAPAPVPALVSQPPPPPVVRHKKSFVMEKPLVKGKVELEALVKLVSSLLDLACKEACKEGKKGLVLVIEDIQWLDVVSLQVLVEMVERELFPPQVYLLLSMRNNHEAKMDQFLNGGKMADVRTLLETELRDSCAELKNFQVFEVDVLTRMETDQLVNRLLIKNAGEWVSDEVKDDVFAATGGMPNAVADVIDLICAGEGAVFLDPPPANQWRWKTKLSFKDQQGGRAVLVVARQAYLSRIDHLDLETRDFLKIAACLAEHKTKFKLENIAQVIKRDLEVRGGGNGGGGNGRSSGSTSTKHQRHQSAAGIKVPSVEYIALRLQTAVEAGLLKNRTGMMFLATEEWSFPSSAICETVLELVPADRLREIQDGGSVAVASAATPSSSSTTTTPHGKDESGLKKFA